MERRPVAVAPVVRAGLRRPATSSTAKGRRRWWRGVAALLVLSAGLSHGAEKVLVDLDIGDDIDDAFALALVLASPEFEVVGISTAWGDTALRVRLVKRLLHEAGRDDIPVAQGIVTTSTTVFSQARWARRRPDDGKPVPDAVDFLLDNVTRMPNSVTVLALGPMTNLAAARRRDPQRFARIGRIVMMGGSVRRGYGRTQYGPPGPAAIEYNVHADVAAAREVMQSGVPISLFPLDATRVQLDDVRRAELFARGTPMTDALTLLYHQWSAADQPWASAIPTLFDVVPVAATIDPTLCPTVPMHIAVRDDGSTVEAAGPPGVQACLASDGQRVLDLLMRRLVGDGSP